jgi:hypothetical protein
MLRKRRPRKRNGARRKIEDVSVPMQGSKRVGGVRQSGVGSTGFAEMYVVPTEFLSTGSVYPCTECAGEELTAQADAEHRGAPPKSLFDQQDLASEVRILRRLVDGHGSPHHHQAREGAKSLRYWGAKIHSSDLRRRSDGLDRVSDATWTLDGYMLEDQNFGSVFHGVIAARPWDQKAWPPSNKATDCARAAGFARPHASSQVENGNTLELRRRPHPQVFTAGKGTSRAWW